MGEPRRAARRDKTRRMIRERLHRAAAEAELSSVAAADGIATFVDTVLTGMAAQARDGASRAQLLDAARWTFRAWPSEGEATAPGME